MNKECVIIQGLSTMKKEFIVIQERNIMDFKYKVNRYIEEGWVVQGGVCYADGTYCIGMIR